MKTQISALILIAIVTTAAWSQESDGCRDVLELTGRDHTVEDQRIGVLVDVYDKYCEGDSEKSGANFQSGGEYLKGISGFLNGANSQETVRNFCKEFSSDYRRNETHYKDVSQTVHQSVQAWLQCKQLAIDGVLFYPKLVPTVFVVGLKRTNAHGVKLTGMSYKSDLLTCTVPGTEKGASRIPVNQAIPVDLTDKVWSVTCLRTAQNKVYPQADIVIETDSSDAFTYTIPPDKEYEYQFASNLERDMTALKGRITKQEDRHYTIKWDEKSTEISQSLLQDPADVKKELGKRDFCELVGEKSDIKVKGMTSCALTQSEKGWTLEAQHTQLSDEQGGIVGCTAVCGTIQ